MPTTNVEGVRAKVLIRPKQGILDPQGKAIERALPALGFDGVSDVRVGRLVELEADDPERLAELCEKLLANPLIEDYEIELDGEASQTPPPARPLVDEEAVGFGVIQFPGSCDERDALLACRRVGDARLVWHEETDLEGVDVVVVPGGFSYGDYLRAGAIARFAPAMEAVAEHAAAGKPVLGICNGFQVLCEAGLLPGALLPNDSLRFVCRQVELVVENAETPFTRECRPGQRLSIPVKHESGRYFAPPEQLDELEARGGVVLSYAPGQNPNGSAREIAAVVNERGNVMGLMPHPEHAVDPLTGSTDGLLIFASLAALADASREPLTRKSARSRELLDVLEQHRRLDRRQLAAAIRIDQLEIEPLVALDQVEDLLVDLRQLLAERLAVAAHRVDELPEAAGKPLPRQPRGKPPPQGGVEPVLGRGSPQPAAGGDAGSLRRGGRRGPRRPRTGAGGG